MAGGGSERAGPALARVVAVLLALPAVMGASCRARPEDCRHDSLERCTWEEAVNESATRGAEAGEDEGDIEYGEGGEAGDGVSMSELERDELDETLVSMIDIMAGGLEWELADERARTLCRERKDGDGELVEAPVTLVHHGEDESPRSPPPDGADPDKPKPKPKRGKRGKPDEPEIWRCSLEWLKINEVELVLEASEGVISLSAEGLAREPSEAVAAFAQARFDDWCATEFEEFEGVGLDVVRRCDLPEGPYLVIARFPRDKDAMTWQVSIAVVDAG